MTMALERPLTAPERRLLRAMRAQEVEAWPLAAVLEACGTDDQAVAVGAGSGLTDLGLAQVSEVTTTWCTLDTIGRDSLDGLLEERLLDWIEGQGGSTSIAALTTSGIADRKEMGAGIGLLRSLGASMVNGQIHLPEDRDGLRLELDARRSFLQSMADTPIESVNLDPDLLAMFQRRSGFIERTDRTVRTWSITPSGRQIEDDALEDSIEVTTITPDLLQGESWREATFRPYDVSLEAAMPRRGRTHPLQSLIERIRSIFLEMGFSEIEGDFVQSAGWNMDALFIPQDHPAREMQDTFYLEHPDHIEVPAERLEQWRDVHVDGGATESRGWGGPFSEEISQRPLLRTHTTVNTIQYLAEHPSNPCRVFSVDRVFRKESIDRTHLPEFHQIEGIIMEEDANLPMLVTTLRTFYTKMGCPDVRVRPAYFPYTEPSLEVEVKWRGAWLELGGAGIFRPEVTEPLGCMGPVCAWGMGLERLAMLVLGLDDIRQLYLSDLEVLSQQVAL